MTILITGGTSAYLSFQPDLDLRGSDAVVGAFARRAVALGCRRLVLLSGRGEDRARDAEAAFTASGADLDDPAFGLLLPDTESFWAEEIATGSLTMVESTVGEPFVDADDIADVAVVALLDPAHVGRIHELTGLRLVTFRDIAQEIGAAYGYQVAYRELPVQDYVATLVSTGLSQQDATGLALLFDEDTLATRGPRMRPGTGSDEHVPERWSVSRDRFTCNG